MMLMILLFSMVSALLALVFFILICLLSKKINFDREYSSPFECGFSTKEESRFPFSLRFFLVALIFLIFDVELLILFPFLSNLMFSFSLMSLFMYFLFLFFLSLGLFYEWNNMMLEWV